MSANVDLNQRPDYDAVLQDIADYVLTTASIPRRPWTPPATA